MSSFRVFISYSFQDYHEVQQIMESVRGIHSLKCIYLKHRVINPFWKKRAEHCLSKSDCILCVISSNSISSKYVLWEIELAEKLGKRIYFLFKDKTRLDDMDAFHFEAVNSVFEAQNRFMESERNEFERILFNKDRGFDINEHTFFEQYKIMVASSEKLIKRRQVVNTFFLTLNLGICSAVGITVTKDGNSVFLLILSIIGFIASYSWRKTIKSFGQLNAGKFKVINTMEKYLSASIFKAEWIALGEGKDKDKYSTFTNVEQNMPNILAVIYLATCGYVFWAAYGVSILNRMW